MKKILSNIRKHKKIILTLTFAAAVSTIIYTDPLGFSSNPPISDYLYNKDYSDNGTKILGEAALVDSKTDLYDNNDDRYFSTASLNREKSRDEALEKLNKSLEKAKTGSDEAKEITKSIDTLTAQIKLESDVEALISAKLASECVAVINEKSAQVVVSKDALSEDATLQIIDVITTNTDLTADKIKISQSE